MAVPQIVDLFRRELWPVQPTEPGALHFLDPLGGLTRFMTRRTGAESLLHTRLDEIWYGGSACAALWALAGVLALAALWLLARRDAAVTARRSS